MRTVELPAEKAGKADDDDPHYDDNDGDELAIGALPGSVQLRPQTTHTIQPDQQPTGQKTSSTGCSKKVSQFHLLFFFSPCYPVDF